MDLTNVAVAIMALATVLVMRQQLVESVAERRYAAFLALESEANTVPFLEVHGLTRGDLDAHELTLDEFRLLLMRTNVLWMSSRSLPWRLALELAWKHEWKEWIARRIVWSEKVPHGRFVRSSMLAKAWPLLEQFYGCDWQAVLTPLVRAGIAIGREERAKSDNPQLNHAESGSRSP